MAKMVLHRKSFEEFTPTQIIASGDGRCIEMEVSPTKPIETNVTFYVYANGRRLHRGLDFDKAIEIFNAS